MTKAEVYRFLHVYCKHKVITEHNKENNDVWKACFDLLDEEFNFHQQLLEGRE